MTTAEFGNGSVPMARMEAVVSELRLLKSGMADMQGRLEALLIEIGTELQHGRAEIAPAFDILPDRQDDAGDLQDTVAETLIEVEGEAANEAFNSEEQADTEPAIVAESERGAEEPILMLAIEQSAATAQETHLVAIGEIDAPVAASEMSLAASIEPIAPAVLLAGIEIPDIAAGDTVAPVGAEAAAEIPAEPITLADLPVETVPTTSIAEAQPIEAPVIDAALPANVVVLAERRAAPRKGRVVMARAARWAAVIALMAMAAAVAATGTGFAGNGEPLAVKRICALAGEACSIMLGTP